MLSTKLVSSSQLIILYPFHMFLNEHQKMVLLFTIEERKNGNKVALVTNTKITNRQEIGSSLKNGNKVALDINTKIMNWQGIRSSW